jgi:hypothetical protein
MSTPTDESYITGRYSIEPWLLKQTAFLKSKTPREELAGFLVQRGQCWMEAGDYKEAVEAFIWAGILEPTHKLHEECVLYGFAKWRERLTPLIPPNFPRLQVRLPPTRHFPEIPEGVEANLVDYHVLESHLRHPEFVRRVVRPCWDSPHRRPPHVPDTIIVEMRWDNV